MKGIKKRKTQYQFRFPILRKITKLYTGIIECQPFSPALLKINQSDTKYSKVKEIEIIVINIFFSNIQLIFTNSIMT